MAQRASGDAAAAQATFERLIAQLEPKARHVDDSLVPVILAQAYAEAGNQAAALDSGRLALELFGNDANMRPTAQLALAQVLMMGGDAGRSDRESEGDAVPLLVASTPRLCCGSIRCGIRCAAIRSSRRC